MKEIWNGLTNKFEVVQEGGAGSGRYPSGSSNNDSEGTKDFDSNPASWAGMGGEKINPSEKVKQDIADTKIRDAAGGIFKDNKFDQIKANTVIADIATHEFSGAYQKDVTVSKVRDAISAGQKSGSLNFNAAQVNLKSLLKANGENSRRYNYP